MKRIFTIISLIFIAVPAFSQINANGIAGNMLILSIGANKTFINNPGFDAWTKSNYNKTEGNLMSGHLDFAIITKAYDFGIHASAPFPYRVSSLYFGKRLTTQQSKISSFLNLEIGELEAIYTDIAPVDYIPTAAEEGRKLQLHYDAFYFGLSSKNYINALSFKSGKGKKAVSFNSGFYLDLGYEPWGGDWSYGYYTGSGKYAEFHSHTAYGIPHLNNLFIDAGIFLGMGS